jgi:hypothetical protein
MEKRWRTRHRFSISSARMAARAIATSSAFPLSSWPALPNAWSQAAQPFDPSSVETTYRLSEAIAASPKIRPYFTQDLMSANGLNVEGLAVADGKLFAGLRAPTLDGKAFIVAVDADRLFNEKASTNEGDVKTISVPMGAGRGIRDLARLNDRQLLILSGPAQDEPVPFDSSFRYPS